MVLKLAIFISGRGSNMLSILKACENPDYPAEVKLVFSNRPDAAGLKVAQEKSIAVEVIDHKAYDSREAFEEQVSKCLKNYDVDLIVLAGFMRVLSDSFVKQWPERIINIHPSLLPEYKGLHPHERAIKDGKTESGCSVHYVTPELDSGPVIRQKRVPILPGDTAETLADRILAQEHILYPEAIKIIADSIDK
ncbi:MAG: phosphoribosylglycinamide formyltransferase [Alphaproteobacteria bacterium]|nr:phosphoribosylglycinamide formyltransferase [Alphaproteobacteria bacterium]